MRRLLLAVVVISLSAVVVADDREFEASGIGSSYRGAVNEALISAMETAEGVTLSSTEKAEIHSSEESVSSTAGNSDRTAINDSIAKNMQKWASGKISGYEVLSDEFDQAAGKYRVRLRVRLPGAYVVGLDPANRRRMAVVPFRSETGDSISWYGKAESSSAWASMLADKLNEHLTQTRKFTMLDRQFDSEVSAELARLSGPNAAKADAVRVNQKLGTDYLVVGSVRFSPVVAPGTNPLTGQPLPAGSQRFAEVSYRVLLAPTGQLKWSDSVVIDAVDFLAADIGSFMSATANAAAMRIADTMMSNILPFEIVGVTDSGAIIIGEGGKSLVVGERLNVFVLGKMMTDSRTGEDLEQLEEPVGTVEVTAVNAKMSYAKVVEGNAGRMKRGCRLRRPLTVVPPAGVQAPPPATAVRGTSSGGVVVPF